MDNIEINVLNVCEHFTSNLDNLTYGLYEIKLNNDKYFIYRNGDSWGVLSHRLGQPVTQCISYLRDDRIDMIEDAINSYMVNQ